MLIHLGNNEFVNFSHCEAIINLATVDQETSKQIRSALKASADTDLRAAVLTTSGKWLGSPLSPEILAERGFYNPFVNAVYINRRLYGYHRPRNRN